MRPIGVLSVLICAAYSAPSVRIMIEQSPAQLLTLPSNATSIRADISDSFSCEGREYGYYADVDNDCQLFHVCLPVTYATGRMQTFRWSFICPDDTVFNQEIFTCTRSDESIDCAESPRFYNLNAGFGDSNVNSQEVDSESHHGPEEEAEEKKRLDSPLGEPSQSLEPDRKPETNNRRTSKY